MRIVYLSDSSIPSSSANSVHVMKMCEAFTAAGHAVSLRCYRTRGDTKCAFKYYNVQPTFDIAPIPKPRVPATRRLIRAFDSFRSIPGSSRPDLIYGRDLYGLIATSRHGIPIVFEAHTPPRSKLDTYMTSLLFRQRTLVRLVVISQALARKYSDLFPALPRHRIHVAHDSANLPKEEPRHSLPWPGRPGVLQLGYAGSLLQGKGSEMVVRLAHALPMYDFHLVGGDIDSVRRLRREVPDSNIYFHGHVPHALVSSYLARFDVALFPMQTKVILSDGTDIGSWTSPLKLFEYMASGKAIIGSDLDIVREVLSHQTNALLVPPADTNAWVTAITRLAADSELRSTLGRTAREGMLRHHTWSARATAVLAGINAQ